MCREALRLVGRSFSDYTQFSPELVLDLGGLEFPKSHSAFGDAVMTGEILPALFIRIGETLLPVAPRNAIINIVDFWGHRAQATPFRGHRSFTQQVSEFLASRVDLRSITRGPCWIRDEHRGIQAPFAAVLRGAHGFYFVITLNRENLKHLPTIETELLDLVANSPNWGIQIEGPPHGFQIRHADGSGLKPDEIVVLAVLPQNPPRQILSNFPTQDRLMFFQLPIWCRFSIRSRKCPNSIDFGLMLRKIEAPSGLDSSASRTNSQRSAIPTAF